MFSIGDLSENILRNYALHAGIELDVIDTHLDIIQILERQGKTFADVLKWMAPNSRKRPRINSHGKNVDEYKLQLVPDKIVSLLLRLMFI